MSLSPCQLAIHLGEAEAGHSRLDMGAPIAALAAAPGAMPDGL